ncbi:uncharacterized protein [Lolium perenne]|uniref:uncharacterized protein n=1 Tax=Lolium perenne TaxID=4522 RepID=UPI003A9A2A25
MDYNPEILSMNVRGLNDPVKRDAVREFVASVKVNLVALQETKFDAIDAFSVMQCLGPSFDGFAFLPAQQTRGGVLVAWDSSVMRVDIVALDSFCVSAQVSMVGVEPWWFMAVYGPQTDEEKRQFLRELTERRSRCPGPWLLIEDFNMILRACEKNNLNINRSVMNSFREFVGQRELKDLYMHGRLFTWSNGQEVPTMTRIDSALASVEWDLMFPDACLQALSATISDHVPLHLWLNNGYRPKQRFRFEVFWTKLLGFLDAVREAWVCDPTIVDPFKRLDALYRNTAAALQSWGQRSVGNIKIQMAFANTIIMRFDVAQKRRQLLPVEQWLRNSLKLIVLGLSSLERTIARQRSRVRWLKEGDANSKLFHAIANGRRAKNFIHAVRAEGQIFTDQEDKVEAFFRAYAEMLGQVTVREHTIDLRSKAWSIIKGDVMAAVLKLEVGDGRGFDKLNKSLITLIPKRGDAVEIDQIGQRAEAGRPNLAAVVRARHGAADEGLLSMLPGCQSLQRISIYADDVALFLKPLAQELVTIQRALSNVCSSSTQSHGGNQRIGAGSIQLAVLSHW